MRSRSLYMAAVALHWCPQCAYLELKYDFAG
ncbi:hypothetical protein SAMN05216466_102431 [Paraburkholderia phenazinium]|uniref:Uncharacterized protein n=1 Tax=Paraburkholderia phenazinium TaxID=60549 RepID=A0A1G7S9D3_9BURK|nr:hypothetical protein SAMN05216466_102431 [Paraburkholderia phenazinium]